MLSKHVQRMTLIKIEPCKAGCHFTLDVSKGLHKYALGRECHYWCSNCRNPTYVHGASRSMLPHFRELLDSFVAESEAVGEGVMLKEAKLRKLIQLMQTAV